MSFAQFSTNRPLKVGPLKHTLLLQSSRPMLHQKDFAPVRLFKRTPEPLKGIGKKVNKVSAKWFRVFRVNSFKIYTRPNQSEYLLEVWNRLFGAFVWKNAVVTLP